MSTVPGPAPGRWARNGRRSGLEAITGSHCPASGTWAIRVGERSVVVWLPEGQLMPPALGLPRRWTYLHEAGHPV